MELENMEKMQIEAQVTSFLKMFGYRFDQDDYVDVVKFVQQLGFTVGNAQLADTEDGFLAIQKGDTSNDKIIGVNANRSLEWKRFIIAHEFGHSVLHYKAGEIYLHRENKKGKDGEENDADYFAAALLMPERSFKRLYEKFASEGSNRTAICFQLATKYRVPVDSVSRRIDEVIDKRA